MRNLLGTTPPPEKVFANRELRMADVKAIGFDYDYTLEEGGVAADGKRSGSYPRGCMNFALVVRRSKNAGFIQLR